MITMSTEDAGLVAIGSYPFNGSISTYPGLEEQGLLHQAMGRLEGEGVVRRKINHPDHVLWEIIPGSWANA